MLIVEDSARTICEFSEARDRVLSFRVACRMFLRHASSFALDFVCTDHASTTTTFHWQLSGVRILGSELGSIQHLRPKYMRLGNTQGTEVVQRLLAGAHNPCLKVLNVHGWQPCPKSEPGFPLELLEAARLALKPACNITDLFWYNNEVPLYPALRIITQFRQLVSLRMRISGAELEKECSCELLQFKQLADLPHLREFELQQTQAAECCRARGLDCWVKHDTVTCVAKALTNVKQLRKINWSDLPLWSEHSVPAVVNMMSSLQNLLELRTLYACHPEFWDALRRGGGHQQLQRLRLMYFAPSAADLQAMAQGIVMCLPKLELLVMALFCIPADPSECIPDADWKQFLTATLGQMRSCRALQWIQLEATGPAGSEVVDASAAQADLGANGPKLHVCESD